ncbi:amidohydrolase [Aliamphritea ceti]|uniref:amidohydrolase n=1 Tax=Aliamphritea ceti TaxID=1524258 RepID=UPI0021C2F66A|nr:amidohydrolase [Aliamphritea ceti]
MSAHLRLVAPRIASKKLSSLLLVGAIASAYSFSLAAAPQAFVNAQVFTSDSSNLSAEAFVVEDGKFALVGSNKEVQAYIADHPGTVTEDMANQRIIPGLYDSHIHALSGGEEALFTCNFANDTDIPGLLKAVADCAAKTPAGSWIEGGAWGPGLQQQATANAADFLQKLDEAAQGHPLVLRDFSNHNVLVNSVAMTAANITPAEEQAFADLIVRDPQTQQMSGFFHEGAGMLVRRAVPGRTAAQYQMAMRKAVDTLHGYGIVGVKDSFAGDAEIDTYLALDNQGELNLHAALSIGWHAGKVTTEEDKAVFIARINAGNNNPEVNTRFSKIAVDGIPPTQTAAFIEPYLPAGNDNRGALEVTPEKLTEDLIWMDALGVTVQAHTVGDRAVRVMLDAVEATRKQNGNSGLRHDLAHACLVDPDDVARFAELNAVANYSPMFWFPSGLVDGMKALLGEERAGRYCATRSMIEAGAAPTAGSDWPVVASVNPWPGIEAFVTRQAPDGSRPGEQLWADQKVTLEQALVMFTMNGAKALRVEDRAGSITVGKAADFIVLDRDVFAIAPADIGNTQVRKTYFGGQPVYVQQQ